MKAKSDVNNLLKNNIVRIALGTIAVLLIPLIAMQFTSEVKWSLIDFVVIGVLLFGAGLFYDFVARRLKNKNQRIALAVAVVLAVLYIWAELAVGVLTNLGS